MDEIDETGRDLHAEADLTFGPCGDPSCPTGSSVRVTSGRGGDAHTSPPPSPPVTLTRRTPRFGALAAMVEAELGEIGVVVDEHLVDEALRARVRDVGLQMGVSDRTALGYAPDESASAIAAEILLLTRTASPDPERSGGAGSAA